MAGNIDPDVLLEFMNDPANAELLAQMGAYDDKSHNLDRRSAMAQHALGTPGAEGRQVGHMYVASSPLEHIGNAVMRGVGASQMNQINGQRDAMTQGNVGAAKGLAAAMSQAMKARRAQANLRPAQPPQMVTDEPALGAGDMPYDPSMA